MKKIIQVLLTIVLLANVVLMKALSRLGYQTSRFGVQRNNAFRPAAFHRFYSNRNQLPGGMKRVTTNVTRVSSGQGWGAWLSSLLGWNKQSSGSLSERINIDRPLRDRVSPQEAIVWAMCDELDQMIGKSGTFEYWETRVGLPNLAAFYKGFAEAFQAAAENITTIDDLIRMYDIVFTFLTLRGPAETWLTRDYTQILNDAAGRITGIIKKDFEPQMPDEIKNLTEQDYDALYTKGEDKRLLQLHKEYLKQLNEFRYPSRGPYYDTLQRIKGKQQEFDQKILENKQEFERKMSQ